MTSRRVTVIAVAAAIAALVSILPPIIERLSPPTGLVRSMFTNLAFGGAPTDTRTNEINLRFLDEQSSLPRQNFSVRWRGYFFVRRAQTIEFFAGGNDEVELRVDGELLLRRSLAEGMRTVGRKVRVEAGAHEIAVDYQQFGGSMALNIQRALEGQQPAPFSSDGLYAKHVDSSHVLLLDAARWMRRTAPYVWSGFAILVIGIAVAPNFGAWRRSAAPRSLQDYAARVWLVAAPALLGPAVVFALGPHTIFANNVGEFSISYRELAAPWLLRTVVLNWIILVAIGCAFALISEKAARMYATALFAVGLLLWGQGNLWNADYGVLAGQDLDLATNAWRTPYELVGWAAALLVSLVFFQPISRVAPFASLVFLGLQAAAIAASRGESDAAGRGLWVEPPAAIYQFSATRNVIHVVLDEFQADVFDDILQQDRAALDRQFAGFQYFADHAGSFPTTSFSMPAMLAGLEYRNQKPAPEFIRDAFKQSSVFEQVSKAGYDVDAASIIPTDSFEQWLGQERAPNWKGARFRIRKPFVSRDDYREVSARQLLELSLFRHVPHAAKAFSVDRPDSFYRPIAMDRTESPAQVRRHEASNSAAFLEQFIGAMRVGRDRPVYKLLHVGVPHRPIVVDRDCRFGFAAMSRESYTEQSRCAIQLVAALLDRARALGIYDTSLIIVSSDHGTDLMPSGFVGKSESLSLIPGPSTVRLPAIASTAKAVMLIKLPNRTGPITISDAPTSHVDLPSTILHALGLPGAAADGLMFERDPRQPRTRLFGMYSPNLNGAFPRHSSTVSTC